MNTNGFQTVVKAKQAFGIPGEFRDSSVKRVLPYELGATANIGNPAYLIAASGKVTDKFATGTAGKFLGIFVGPKEYVINDSDLNPTMTMDPANGQAAQVASLGHVIVKAGEAGIKVGDAAYFGPSGWCKTQPTAGTSVDGRKLGTFIDDATAGEPVGVSVMEAI